MKVLALVEIVSMISKLFAIIEIIDAYEISINGKDKVLFADNLLSGQEQKMV